MKEDGKLREFISCCICKDEYGFPTLLGWMSDVGCRYFDENGHLTALNEEDKHLLKREYETLKEFAKELKEFATKNKYSNQRGNL